MNNKPAWRTAIPVVFVIVGLHCVSLVAALDGSFFDSSGVRIHYLEEGAGEAVVLIHGFAGSADTWVRNGVFRKLASRYRVIALDCRGHGGSEKPHEVSRYGREMGRDVIRLLDHLGVKRAHIIGYSMGAVVTSQLLIANPERFLSATLGGHSGIRSWNAEVEERTKIEAAEMDRGGARHLLSRVAPTNGPTLTEDQVKQASERLMAGQDPVALAAAMRSFRDLVTTPAQMSAVKVPTLGVVGTADPYFMDFRELKMSMPQLKLIVIDDASHGSAAARPEFIQSIVSFLHDVAPSRQQ